MIADVDKLAGKVWEILGQKGEVGIVQLPRIMKEQSAIVYQSLGWLARESKVQYKSKGGKVYVSLTAAEQQVYKNAVASKREAVLV